MRILHGRIPQSLRIIAPRAFPAPAPSSTMTQPDLHSTRQAILAGQTNAPEQAERCLAIASSPACANVFAQLTPESLLGNARQMGIDQRPLAGLSVSVKDLFDVAGQITAAGSQVLANAPAAEHDCPAVARLRAAGAGLLPHSLQKQMQRRRARGHTPPTQLRPACRRRYSTPGRRTAWLGGAGLCRETVPKSTGTCK